MVFEKVDLCPRGISIKKNLEDVRIEMSNLEINNSINNRYFSLNPRALYQFSGFILSPEQEMLFLDGKAVKLGKKSVQCLMLLIANANKIVLKDSFFEAVWEDKFVEDGVLSVNIWHLRNVLGKNRIHTFPKRGYKFNGEVVVINSDFTEPRLNKVEHKRENPPAFRSFIRNFKSMFANLF